MQDAEMLRSHSGMPLKQQTFQVSHHKKVCYRHAFHSHHGS